MRIKYLLLGIIFIFLGVGFSLFGWNTNLEWSNFFIIGGIFVVDIGEFFIVLYPCYS
jgi:hypothetical protein